MKRLMNKKRVYCLLGILVLGMIFYPRLRSSAEGVSFITLEQEGSKNNEAAVYLQLLQSDALDDIASLQIGFQLQEGDLEDAVFLFDSSIKSDKNITVKEYRYDEDKNVLTVYLSGKEAFLEKGKKPVRVGKIHVKSDSDVVISVSQELCSAVDTYHTLNAQVDLGELKPYRMALNKENPIDPEVPVETDPSVKDRTSNNSDYDYGEQEKSGTWSKSKDVWTFKKSDGSYAANEWVMADGSWYWFNQEGIMQTGWIKLSDVWYYLNPSGAMQTGWVWVDNKWYYCNTSGIMKTGWIQDQSIWYHLNESGEMDTGWLQSGDQWYYLGADGKMMTDTVTPDGYQLDRNGVRSN